MDNLYEYNFLSNSFLLRYLTELTANKYENIFSKITNYSMDIAMISAPLITYIFQIRKFHKTQSSKGFSKFICLLLFLGNILRIFFWYGTRFKKVLLYQSIGIVIFQIILIHLCIKYQEKTNNDSKTDLPEIKNINEKTNIENKNNINIIKNFIFEYFSKTIKSNYWQILNFSKTLNPKLFWNWFEESEYYKFMFFIIAIFSFLSIILKKNKNFFQIIGILAAFFEACICIPQVISNCKTKVTKNISFTMIFLWFLGDSFRLFYNIKYKAPLQLIIGISAQVFFDFVVLFQLILYKNNNYKEKDKVNPNKKQIEEINQLMKSIDELNVGK